MIDVSGQINSVGRNLGRRTIAAGEAVVMTIAQTYKADLDDVWDACTNIERIPRWFLPITGELRLGGTYQLEGNAGGTVERCDAPHSFAATWEFGGDVSWIEVRLTETAEGTRFELEHVAHVKDEFWDQYGPGAVGLGWDSLMLGLSTHLASGSPVDPAAAQAWMGSPEGVSFLQQSSERWYAENVAFGTPEGKARAAADAVTAAYTSGPPEG